MGALRTVRGLTSVLPWVDLRCEHGSNIGLCLGNREHKAKGLANPRVILGWKPRGAYAPKVGTHCSAWGHVSGILYLCGGDLGSSLLTKRTQYGRIYMEAHMPYSDPEKRREAHRKSDKKHPGNKQKSRRSWYLRSIGWTQEMYDTTSAEQGHRCAICRQLPTGKGAHGTPSTLAADHNHATMEPRALLCNACNTAIGLLRESPEICRSADEYLEAWAV
jgi:hypothetical protein